MPVRCYESQFFKHSKRVYRIKTMQIKQPTAYQQSEPKIQLDGSGVVAIAAATLAGADDADTVVYDANQMFVDASGLPPRRAACCLTVELACLSCESDSLQSAKSSSLQSRIKCKKV